MKKIVLLSIMLCVIGCKRINQEKTPSPPDRPIREIISDVVNKGDTNAYEDLSLVYFYSNYGSACFLPYALIMANKYNYPKAYYDVFDCLREIYEGSTKNLELDSLDDETRKIALDYLRKAAEKGYGKSVLEEYYLQGKYFPKYTVLGTN